MDGAKSVWLITGTTSGLGKRLVASVLARGDYVVAAERRLNRRSLELSLSEDDRGRLRWLELDMDSDLQTVQGRVDEALGVWGRIDVLVNNAGSALPSTLEEGGSAAAIEQFQTNVFGTLNVTNSILPHMRQRRFGTIIFVGSRMGWKCDIPVTFAETYAAELRPFGIRVLIAIPGEFRVEGGIANSPCVSRQDIRDYDQVRVRVLPELAAKAEVRGDPVKGMSLLVDAVKGEGKAQGKEWADYFVLGRTAYATVREKCWHLLKSLDAWQDVAEDLDFDHDE
ncbi:uncharacterized protein FIBRA_07701 [Fibroporia radiculosa]|uniref:Uncharacterized protein n=1 Tax=Fibroporia radiculosa TaxID=599839 RepID=J4GVG7_9APHY|nr:uncharacterized protein FIBRA_07701 [Fibroporia radiculosa]CCM05480.1 predicted protein [Fibroporia radiculosa]